MLKLLRKFLQNEDGASMVEYTVLLGLMLAVTIGVLTTVGGNLDTIWDAVDAGVQGTVDALPE